MTSFQELGLSAPIQKALAEERYVTPTPIQLQAIPHILADRDLLGIAQTGTGKTAAFALPILNHLARVPRRPGQRACRVLVLSPTRELSDQILASFKAYGRHLKFSSALVIGGVPIGRQIRSLASGIDVLVATPGRLQDLFNQRAVRLDEVEIFVLDEADRMLDMGFIHAIRAIVAKLPKKRQNLFFSATMPPAIADLAGRILHNPVSAAVTPVATTVESVEQRVILTERAAKPALLADILREDSTKRTLVFTRTKRGADRVVQQLAKVGIAAEAIHGNKSQGQRERVLGAFRAGRVHILIATDIAARGIDVEGITYVVNYDLPEVPESYVHRIGRTARAGAAGIAISLCAFEERDNLRAIEKLIRLEIPATDRRPHHARPAMPAAPHQHQPPGRSFRRNGHGKANARKADAKGLAAVGFLQPHRTAKHGQNGRARQQTSR